MIYSAFITQVNSCYRGTDDDAPVAGTADYTLWLNTTNRKISEWACDNKITWSSLFEVRAIGTLSATSQTYDLDDDYLGMADDVYIVTTTGSVVHYHLAKPQDRDQYSKSVYVSGANPQVLTFNDTIATTDQAIGGTIYVSACFMPADLTKDKDTIPVDDPYWLVYAVASELAFNDLTYQSKAADLVAKANNLWSVMVSNNRRGANHNPRVARTNVARITGVR